MARLDRRGPWVWSLIAGAAGAGALLAACAHQRTAGEPASRRELVSSAGLADTTPTPTPAPCTGGGVMPDLSCPELPDTSAYGNWVQINGQSYLDFDLWAWNSFIAMSWPARDPSNPAYRGLPDTSAGASFAGVQSGDTLVWETFKEKREVFLADPNTGAPTPNPQPLAWAEAPVYGPPGAQIPCCPGADCSTAGFERHIGSASKFRFNTLDEDIEVPSEALELQAALCQGWVDPSQCTSNPSINTCCTLSGQPVQPRVWKGDPHPTPGAATPVLYEVKLNYDSFQYIYGNQLYDQTKARAAATATSGPITLPARTSAQSNPPAPGVQSFPTPNNSMTGPKNPSIAGYSASDCLSGLPTATKPCAAGAVHLKAAWIELSDDCAEATGSTHHTACAYKYLTQSGGGICKQPALFGLIGLHIIQRIHVDKQAGKQAGSDGAQGPPLGGTYVFASWEHADNFAASPGFTYANYSKAPPTGSPTDPAPFPNIAAHAALPLTRAYSPLPSTTRANKLVHDALGCPSSHSVWCNYHLIGTQYRATNLPSPLPTQLSALPATPSDEATREWPPNSGQPYYLANLVIESNVGLQQFQGLPISAAPGVITVLPHWRPNVTSNFTSAFQRMGDNVANVAFRTQSGGHGRSKQFNMGGCMGCHGVAQLSGYAFSFVLLDNQGGAVPDALPPSGP